MFEIIAHHKGNSFKGHILSGFVEAHLINNFKSNLLTIGALFQRIGLVQCNNFTQLLCLQMLYTKVGPNPIECVVMPLYSNIAAISNNTTNTI